MCPPHYFLPKSIINKIGIIVTNQNKANSRINQIALLRMVQMLGPQVAEAFVALEQQLIKPDGAQNFFNQIGFTNPGDPLNEGDLIPTIHFSLQPFQPIFSEQIELEDISESS